MMISVLKVVLPAAAATWLSLAPLPPLSEPLPVLEVVKVYGKLAGSSCFGKKAPPGSSCQMSATHLKEELGLTSSSSGLSRTGFVERLDKLQFQWPLKPYGVEKSHDKTAVMNKGAETRVYMEQLEARGLYDRRNPTGPLPSSLRPKLNVLLQKEGLEAATVDRTYDALRAGESTDLTAQQVDKVFGGKNELDYYDFIKLLGRDSIFWE